MYIVSYDITNDKLRRKIAKEMENYGIRVQYSVFECDLKVEKYAELYAKLIKLMGDSEEGNIRIYNLCSNCKEKTRLIGVEDIDSKDDRGDVIVV